jgi:hypothetical protein
MVVLTPRLWGLKAQLKDDLAPKLAPAAPPKSLRLQSNQTDTFWSQEALLLHPARARELSASQDLNQMVGWTRP